MKILYIITKSNWGGAQRHVYDLATFSARRGHDVVVALGGNGPLNDRLVADGIRTVPLAKLGRDISVSGDTSSLFNLFSIVKKEKPDIVHLHSPKAAGLGAFTSKILGVKKIVYTIHGWTFNESRPLYQKALIAFITWLTMLWCTDVITLSERELVQGQRFPFVTRKMSLIPLGIAKPAFLSAKDARAFFAEKIHSDQADLGKRTVIGTISELHTNKGLIYLINAIHEIVARFPDILVIVIGGGEQRPYLESLISEKNLVRNIFLIGYVPNAANYLKGFNILTLTSVKEGLPYAILEAGHASLPVIASAVGGIPELVSDMDSGILIQPKKVPEIVHAIEFLLNHKNIQKEYGKSLNEKITTRYTLENMLRRTEAVYLHNLNKNPAQNSTTAKDLDIKPVQ